jgi:hypothetical protein
MAIASEAMDTMLGMPGNVGSTSARVSTSGDDDTADDDDDEEGGSTAALVVVEGEDDDTPPTPRLGLGLGLGLLLPMTWTVVASSFNAKNCDSFDVSNT